MGKIELLDCTLRDGAYVVNGDFGETTIRGVIRNLTEAHVEYIECGWLKDGAHVPGSTYYHIPGDACCYMPDGHVCAKYVAMIDWDRYNLESLPMCDNRSISTIRMVFPHGKQKDALSLASKITEKGYELFLQAANTLAYTDEELIELAVLVNAAGARSLSIVDTFGAMYMEDVDRIFSVLDGHLHDNIKIGFHSHNNQQLSYALSIRFMQLGVSSGRNIIVDASLCGMGRGAGNATTELVANYMNRKHSGSYDMNEILDAIDMFILHFQAKFQWGYSIPYFIAGVYCCHVNNIAYLTKQHKTLSKDMRLMIESIDPELRKKYDYDNLERIYVQYQNQAVDDADALTKIRESIGSKGVLLLAPGKGLASHGEAVRRYINAEHPFVIGINSIPKNIECDSYFFGSAHRYRLYERTGTADLRRDRVIVTSNVKSLCSGQEKIVNYNLLVHRGWRYFDNSAIMCLRLLLKLGVSRVGIAGFDGFSYDEKEVYDDIRLGQGIDNLRVDEINADVRDMFKCLRAEALGRMAIEFVTPSIYEK